MSASSTKNTTAPIVLNRATSAHQIQVKTAKSISIIVFCSNFSRVYSNTPYSPAQRAGLARYVEGVHTRKRALTGTLFLSHLEDDRRPSVYTELDPLRRAPAWGSPAPQVCCPSLATSMDCLNRGIRYLLYPAACRAFNIKQMQLCTAHAICQGRDHVLLSLKVGKN